MDVADLTQAGQQKINVHDYPTGKDRHQGLATDYMHGITGTMQARKLVRALISGKYTWLNEN